MSAGESASARKSVSAGKARLAAFLIGGLLVSLMLAGFVSNFASSSPDGLDSATRQGCTVGADDEVTSGECAATGTKDHELADGPLADYVVKGVDNKFVATGLSGVAGVLVVFAIGGGLFWLVRPRARAARSGDGVRAARSGKGPTGASDQQ